MHVNSRAQPYRLQSNRRSTKNENKCPAHTMNEQFGRARLQTTTATEETFIWLGDANKGRLLFSSACHGVIFENNEHNDSVRQLRLCSFLFSCLFFYLYSFLASNWQRFSFSFAPQSFLCTLIRSLLFSALFHNSFSSSELIFSMQFFFPSFFSPFIRCFRWRWRWKFFSRLLESFDTNNSAKNKLNRIQKIHHHLFFFLRFALPHIHTSHPPRTHIRSLSLYCIIWARKERKKNCLLAPQGFLFDDNEKKEETFLFTSTNALRIFVCIHLSHGCYVKCVRCFRFSVFVHFSAAFRSFCFWSPSPLLHLRLPPLPPPWINYTNTYILLSSL